jgi:Na+/H+ antiporter NhaD/arsenite permease-like protein
METIIVTVFVIGYVFITLEHSVNINKTATAILTGVLCWTIYMLGGGHASLVPHELKEHLAGISEILFFLLGAMTIVELVDAHDGFKIITSAIHTRDKVKLIWLLSFITFFLSAILDNLTTTIVMISLLRNLINDREDRLLFTGMVVIAANAGGAWTPIGDVTTTMLWIGGQITTSNIMIELFIPSLVCMIVPLLVVSKRLKGVIDSQNTKLQDSAISSFERNLIFAVGIGSLVFVPVFKTITGLPPYLGMLLGLSIVWIVTEFLHKKKESETKNSFSVSKALQKIDTSSILFFLGILLCIAALESTHILSGMANWMTEKIGNMNVIVLGIGLLSAIIDNVPLVAACMGMYDLAQYPTDHYFWEFLAYCAGTGGSILIIGSAAGVAAMGLEKIDFFWYVKNISLLALVGYFAGAGVYILISYIM